MTRNSLETNRGPSDWFTGAVYVDTIAAPSDGSRIGAASVHFTPGARTAWHTHPHGQTIWVTEGVGPTNSSASWPSEGSREQNAGGRRAAAASRVFQARSLCAFATAR